MMDIRTKLPECNGTKTALTTAACDPEATWGGLWREYSRMACPATLDELRYDHGWPAVVCGVADMQWESDGEGESFGARAGGVAWLAVPRTASYAMDFSPDGSSAPAWKAGEFPACPDGVGVMEAMADVHSLLLGSLRDAFGLLSKSDTRYVAVALSPMRVQLFLRGVAMAGECWMQAAFMRRVG